MKLHLKLVVRSAATAAALLLAPAAQAQDRALGAAQERIQPVKAPYWGSALFDFYQERYFSAITGLMASQHFGRVTVHADEAEVLRGGLLLSYGLHHEAGRIFTALIDKGAPLAVRDRAWYFLAKIRHQRGLPVEAAEALAKVHGKLPNALEDDRGLLQAQLAMERGDFVGAAALLKALPANSPGAPYARFNLGVALIKSGDATSGRQVLDELGRAPAANDELRSLRDRANVALGFAALQEGRAEVGRRALERVRLAGLHSNKALLGFGWAAANDKDPKQALVSWSELAGRGLDGGADAAVLEARIAVPFALAELGALGASLEGYQLAIDTYSREATALDQSIAAIRSGKLAEALALPPSKNGELAMGWLGELQTLPQMPHPAHLAPVMAQHTMQEALKNLRDLQFLQGNLQGWADNLVVYRDMLAHRSKAYTERLPEVRNKASAINLGAAQSRRDALAAELARTQSETDVMAFANTAEQALLERLAAVRQTVQQMGSDPEATQARERARLAAGAMTWRLAQDYPARLWDASKALKATEAALAQAQQRDAALAAAQRDEPLRLQAFDARIAELDRRIRGLIPQVAALGREQQGQVQELAVAELLRQKERLAVYSTQARFAVAQLYDRAKLAQDAGGSRVKP